MKHYATSAKSKVDCHVMAKTSDDSHVTLRTNIIMGRYILVDQTGYVYYY